MKFRNSRGAHGRAPSTAAVRKRDVFVGGAAFFCYFSFAAERKVDLIHKLEFNALAVMRWTIIKTNVATCRKIFSR